MNSYTLKAVVWAENTIELAVYVSSKSLKIPFINTVLPVPVIPQAKTLIFYFYNI